MSLFWNVEYVVEYFVASFYTFNIIRQAILSTFFAIFLMLIMTWQYKHVCSTLKHRSKCTNISRLRHIIYKCRFVYIFILLQNIKLNKQCIKDFFFATVFINMISNTIIIAGFVTSEYKVFLQTPLKILVFLQIFLIYSSALCFIILSDALLMPAKTIYSSAIKLYRKRYKNIKLYLCISYFYEMIHNKRPFRFNFGQVGKISKKSLLSFWLFYFSILFKVISEFVEKQN